MVVFHGVCTVTEKYFPCFLVGSIPSFKNNYIVDYDYFDSTDNVAVCNDLVKLFFFLLCSCCQNIITIFDVCWMFCTLSYEVLALKKDFFEWYFRTVGVYHTSHGIQIFIFMIFPLFNRCRAMLASLFGLDQEASQGNESFQYTAPKQPRKNSMSGDNPKTETSLTWDSATMGVEFLCLNTLSVFSTNSPETSSNTRNSCSVICHSSTDLQIVRPCFQSFTLLLFLV